MRCRWVILQLAMRSLLTLTALSSAQSFKFELMILKVAYVVLFKKPSWIWVGISWYCEFHEASKLLLSIVYVHILNIPLLRKRNLVAINAPALGSDKYDLKKLFGQGNKLLSPGRKVIAPISIITSRGILIFLYFFIYFHPTFL